MAEENNKQGQQLGITNWAANALAGITGKSILKDKYGRPRMPVPQISSEESLRSGGAARFRFILTLNNFTYGFKNITGMKVSRNLNPILQGGVNDQSIFVGMPDAADTELTLTRGFLIREWPIATTAALMAASQIPNNLLRRTALMAVGLTDAQYTLEHGPAFGDIKVYNPRTFELSDWWTFISYGIIDRSPDGLDASSGEPAMESITLKVTDLKQRSVKRMPTNYNSVVKMFQLDDYENEFKPLGGETQNKGSHYTKEYKKKIEDEGKKEAEEKAKNQKNLGSKYTGEEEGTGGVLGLKDSTGSNYIKKDKANVEREAKKEALKKSMDKKNLGSSYTSEEERKENLKLEEAKKRAAEEKKAEQAQKQKEQDAMDKFISENI